MTPEKGRKPPQKLTFVCKIGGTSGKKRAKRPLFNSFPVPLNAWDKSGTTAGQETNGTRIVFLKIVKKTMKSTCKCFDQSHLHFSRGCEKAMKIVKVQIGTNSWQLRESVLVHRYKRSVAREKGIRVCVGHK
jgi:hypothetical protein